MLEAGGKGCEPKIFDGAQETAKARKHSLEPEKEPAPVHAMTFYPLKLTADLCLPEL